MTDASGAYELTTAPNVGVFSISWSLRLAAPASPDLVAEWFDNQTNRVTSRVVLPQDFNDPQLTLTANAQLAAGGAIAGTVTDAAGAGVSNLRVFAYGPNDLGVATYAADDRRRRFV